MKEKNPIFSYYYEQSRLKNFYFSIDNNISKNFQVLLIFHLFNEV